MAKPLLEELGIPQHMKELMDKVMEHRDRWGTGINVYWQVEMAPLVITPDQGRSALLFCPRKGNEEEG